MDDSLQNLFLIATAAMLAPLIGDLIPGIRIPVIIIEIALGILIGPDLLDLIDLDSGTAVSLALYNLFDTDPPLARLDQNFDPFTASPLGFTAKVGVSQAF